jgi:hypothetical protein
MAKGSMWEKESFENHKNARGKSGKNPTVYIAR